MKTLYYSIIAILFITIFLPLSTAFGQNVTVSNDLDDGNVFHLVAKDTALPGDMMEINGSLVTKDPIKIMLSNPNGTVQVSTTTFADRDGYFTVELKMPKDAMGGTWKLIGKSGNYQRELDINVLVPDVTRTTYCCLISNYTKHVIMMSPLKQLESGIDAGDVKCNQGLWLIFKAENSSPACVKPSTASVLLQRNGWATVSSNSNNPELNNSSQNKQQNYLPNISQRLISMTIGGNTGTLSYLPIMVSDKIILEKPSNSVILQKLHPDWQNRKSPSNSVFEVSDENGNNIGLHFFNKIPWVLKVLVHPQM